MLASALIRESWVSISASRLRTFLAMLGIVIGVGSVVLMIAIGTGSSRQVEKAIKQLGTNLLIITPGATNAKGLQSSSYSSFSIRDAAILSQLPSVGYAAAFTEYRTFQVRSSFGNWSTGVIGTTEAGVKIRGWEMQSGIGYSNEDVKKGERVVVVGSTVADKLFGGREAVGSSIQINSISFRVIGTLKAKGQSIDGRDQDNVIFIPITTAQAKLWGFTYWQGVVQTLTVQAVSKHYMSKATEEIRDTLRKRFRLKSTQADNFTITNLSSITKAATDTTKSMSILLASIASISLVVGGIGIMNIMLVTVSERTREIGIRKAIGASERVILAQFLLEAIFIAFVGSILGLLLGFGLGFMAERYLDVPVYYSLWSVMISLAVASGVGIASGIYPAYKAAKLQPIEALRVG
ncbi:MAG: ABC transporter permease [Alphaproteobacteria bacterium]|nr:ABC transporter permease [Alphaproteobacteria bacterium]